MAGIPGGARAGAGDRVNGSPERYYPLEPRVGWRDYRVVGPGRWSDVDETASAVVGTRCIGIPSVRVGICWALEYLGYRRHTHHVLVPRFMGRCVLNAINRFALPVEVPTPRTALAVVVHQFGFRQRLAEIHAECVSRSLLYVEDSPFGLEEKEEPGPGALAKFVGFSKVLPVLKGGFVLSADEQLLEFIKARRAERSVWSWPVLALMALLRSRRWSVPYSVLGDLAYELYLEARGDNAVVRGNLLRGLERLAEHERIVAQRLALARERLGSRALLPDVTRLAYVIPYKINGKEEEIASVFKRHGFDGTPYHFDMNRNVFDPDYQRVFLLPLNPLIPKNFFASLLHDLSLL